jgi:nucleoside-diphosphate-sugar epimerase
VRLLVLGGTVFLGRHVVEAALARGHEVTAAGLRTRDMRETIADTLAWANAPREPGVDTSKLVATLAPVREAEILAGVAGPRVPPVGAAP